MSELSWRGFLSNDNHIVVGDGSDGACGRALGGTPPRASGHTYCENCQDILYRLLEECNASDESTERSDDDGTPID